MKKMKLSKIIVTGIALLIIFIGIYYIQFTSLGYFETVPVRGFTQVKDNIYLDNDFNGNSSNVLSIIEEANQRVKLFWGDIKSEPRIIISDNDTKLKKMGWTGSPALTTTLVFFGAHSYVVISPNGLNVDVVAHELTHAELHSRIHKGKLLNKKRIPVWFDEGVATQNDYRENYNDNAWVNVTNDGKNITDFSSLESISQFYNTDSNIRRYNYIISKHEVSEWLKEHSIDELIALIAAVNKGESFNKLYSIK
ncbi:MAG: hypothetical protein K0R00_2170 [Herbinix sp.]|jgi:hypothetical protein|nr:hypothetical protein [Herbinix sp.]